MQTKHLAVATINYLVLPVSLWCLLLLPCRAAPSKDFTLVTYPQVENALTDQLDVYFLSLLELALQKAGVHYQLKPVPLDIIVESRSQYFLKQDRYKIHWLNTNSEREEELIPIKIPLLKGLIGWRLFLIKAGRQPVFSSIDSIAELRKLSAGQGHDWPDTSILEANQFSVETSPERNNLFRMLDISRFDYFPRSVIEIWQEQAVFSDLGIETEQTLALHYPAAYYFFLGKAHRKLASAIESGLSKAVEDGSFDRIFYAYYGSTIARANLHQRRIFELHNPLLVFPSDARLWYSPHTTITPPATDAHQK